MFYTIFVALVLRYWMHLWAELFMVEEPMSIVTVATWVSIVTQFEILFFFFWSLYASPPEGALGYEAAV